MKNHDNSGKPATNRGKPPHKGGYKASTAKGVNPFAYWWEIRTEPGTNAPATKVACPWKP